MGIKEWLGSKFLKKAVRKTNTPNSFEKSIDEIMSEEVKKMSSTNRMADKLLKVKLMRQETQKTIDNLKELDDDMEDYEEEESADPIDQIGQMIFKKILGNTGLQNNTAIVGDPGDPLASPVETGGSESKGKLINAVGNLTEEQAAKLNEKLGL